MRVILAALLVVALAGCFATERPRSDYFLVFFAEGTVTLLPEGRDALAAAAQQARRGTPRAVVIRGSVGGSPAERTLAEARMSAVEKGLVAAGVAPTVVQLDAESTDAAEATRLGNGIVVQIERGAVPALAVPPK